MVFVSFCASGAVAKFHCNICQEDIFTVRVKCAECLDFDLCVQCFSCGAEIGQHKNDHKYQIIDCCNWPIFKAPNDWKAKEELSLLESVEHFGFGNWEDVSKKLDTRDAEEVKEHYNSMYIIGNIGRATWSVSPDLKVIDHTSPDGGPLSPSLTTPLPAIELSSQEQQDLGYMPFRDDFEREYDNEAESLTCNLSVNVDDEDIDIALKLAHVDMYSRRLRERLRRKKIVREHSLVSQFLSNVNKTKVPSPKKKSSKEENGKDFQDKMQVFAQFHSATEHEQFFSNVQKEKELKMKIKELMRYRRNGLTKIEDCASYDAARIKREKRKENKKKTNNSVASTAHRRPGSVSSKKNEDKLDGQDEIDDEKKEDQKEVDISTLPGYELLSEKEKKLCYSISLKPAYYISFKTVLLKDHILRKQGNSVKPRYPAGLEKAHRRKIINLLVNSGWITGS